MNPVDFIARRRDGLPHSQEEISEFVLGLTDGSIELHQVSAWLMATRLNGLSEEETIWLTQSLIDSGETVDLSALEGIPVDKHSTGGVGDTTTLIVAPLVAAAGGQVAKMSGRGLGHTGGTLDKLESAGVKVDLTREQFISQVQDIGLAVISQTAKLVPADGVLYSLRDVTATIDSVPLIASSVMSKKLACGAQAIVLDVKYGDGAFMSTRDGARDLAKLMVKIGKGLGRSVRAALSPMDHPLGAAIGNALEVREAIEVLTGKKTGTPLEEVSLALASELLVLAQLAADRESALRKTKDLLQSGKGAEKLAEMFARQGADPALIEHPERLPKAPVVTVVPAARTGYLGALSARRLGLIALDLGAGRLRKNDQIDPAVGLVLKVRVGQKVQEGEPWIEVHAKDQEAASRAVAALGESSSFSPEPVQVEPEIAEWVG